MPNALSWCPVPQNFLRTIDTLCQIWYNVSAYEHIAHQMHNPIPCDALLSSIDGLCFFDDEFLPVLGGEPSCPVKTDTRSRLST